ncbi:Cd(II)/Pb(II)-responsive transcriptional regulator [Andreprevotia chitinilytica]|uniref:Cd(II)/Pb(II)-responsive transcriptional regulator n=1 Tax=Andreprevotia chitinilytica TaxID=396808 RepID=UPI000557B9CF|nr:Cd(II)/Pb(II)-responsive transcriptional regulator [Andreprevotia chitinilytica]
MKIGELAQAAQCSVETVRYYEKEGLLPAPTRTESNYRSYGPEHAERLRFIRNCRALDMTHDEIRTLLGFADDPAAGCGAVNELVDAHIGHVDARIAELMHLKQQLVDLRLRCGGESADDSCGILQGLTEMETEARPAHRHTHLG